MTIENAKKIIAEKYEVEKNAPDELTIYTNYLFNPTDLLYMIANEKNGQVFLTDEGNAMEYTIKTKKEIEKICELNGVEFNKTDMSLNIKLTSIDDVDRLFLSIVEVTAGSYNWPKEPATV